MNIEQYCSAEDIKALMVSNLAEILKVSTDEISIDEHLENYGLDSLQAMIIIGKLEELLGFKPSPVLLWHYPTISLLSQRLSEEVISGSAAKDLDQETVSDLTISAPFLDLAAEVVLDSTIQPVNHFVGSVGEPTNIFLTGATGYLGAFLIRELLRGTEATIYCLVRADDEKEGNLKLQNNLQKYEIWDHKYSSRLIAIAGDLEQPLLGIDPEQFQILAAKIDSIYHSGALLNYVYPYSALKAANVLGTQEVLRFACQTKLKPVHYISSVAVFESTAYAGKVVLEQQEFNDWQGIFLGYSQTKWVAEKLVKIAASRGVPVTIFRLPLISGDSETGICNTHDFINLMIKGCLQMGSFPDVDYMLDMSPVDYASKAIVYLSRQPQSMGKSFHLQHPQPASLTSFVEWVRSFGFSIEMVPYEQWRQELISNVTSVENPLFTLRPFLLERWSDQQLTIPDLYFQSRRPIISCQATLNALAGSSIVCPPIDSQLLMTYTSHLVQSGFLTFA
jgi:thioester reductase-like protein